MCRTSWQLGTRLSYQLQALRRIRSLNVNNQCKLQWHTLSSGLGREPFWRKDLGVNPFGGRTWAWTLWRKDLGVNPLKEGLGREPFGRRTWA
eukprot:1160250-Pelagomonas_calceolata.AAC.4